MIANAKRVILNDVTAGLSRFSLLLNLSLTVSYAGKREYVWLACIQHLDRCLEDEYGIWRIECLA